MNVGLQEGMDSDEEGKEKEKKAEAKSEFVAL